MISYILIITWHAFQAFSCTNDDVGHPHKSSHPQKWGIIFLLLKVAILLQYLRFFAPSGLRGVTFWAAHFVHWGNVAYYIAFTFIFMFVCNPQANFWDKTITYGKCLDIFGINVISAVICLVSDLLILLLPQRMIYQLNLPRRKNIGLAFLFAIGIFCAMSAVRLYYNIHLWKHQHDITYQLGFISYWGTAQIPTGFFIVCFCRYQSLSTTSGANTGFSGLRRLYDPSYTRHHQRYTRPIHPGFLLLVAGVSGM
ncbi:hypothetical protein K505DRAFT_254574 [Melanomma pulvis-pyrius CBS 109.77]|uniref:Rhodopsin domain-containing protein n=1 Tax=Melanomma pulvis-pyrius CBS 109.77 TaxID=1314802 RepID=A0A6A6WY33_9PLEO|nr:hypothetical protein K505DRAFT_254574 [Melanomma pulvis-pyrius CBS 109.77]